MNSASHFKNPMEIMQHNATGILNFIFKKSAWLIQLNELWHREMNNALGQHSCVANFRDHCLVIQVESPVWAARLRFSAPEIIEKLRVLEEFAGLQKVEWYVRSVS